MKKKLSAVILAAASMFAATSASAALVTLGGAQWPPVPSSGLENVQFNVATGVTLIGGQTGGQERTSVMVALGAHPYKAGATMPNDGVSKFYAPLGSWPAEDRANWSFDFSFDAGGCATCSVMLEIDSNPGVGTSWHTFGQQPLTGIAKDSWNMQMDFLEALAGVPFDSNVAGQYSFRATMYNFGEVLLAQTEIDVITGQVPEPASLALAVPALLGVGIMRRRRGKMTAVIPSAA